MFISLKELLVNIFDLPVALNKPIGNLCADSRLVQAGDLFIALKGHQIDSRQYIGQAIERGAVVVLTETEELSHVLTTEPVPVIAIQELAKQLGVIAARFYQEPSRDLMMIGITGTNGKTSCSHFIAQCLERAQRHCGIIGTLGSGFYGNLIANPFTTPQPLELQKILFDLKQQHATTIAMEVSSHALELGRVNGIKFDIAIFTNLTRDHLDFHETLEKYGRAKQRLFEWPNLGYAILNLDDEFGQMLASHVTKSVQVFGYSLEANHPHKNLIVANNIRLEPQGVIAEVTTPWGKGTLHANLLGRFNVSNLLAVLTTLCIMEIPLATALDYLADVTTVAGRLQAFHAPDKPLVVVDYSHTPDALQKGLQELRAHGQGNIWCVFGCGGDRDRGKRPLMGEVAENFADHVIITNDNPRTEDPKLIVDEIVQGINDKKNIMIEHDRARAIDYAIAHAKPSDIVLVAGKGHEDYQIIGTEKRYFSDIDYVKTKLGIGD